MKIDEETFGGKPWKQQSQILCDAATEVVRTIRVTSDGKLHVENEDGTLDDAFRATSENWDPTESDKRVMRRIVEAKFKLLKVLLQKVIMHQPVSEKQSKH
jgi:hypothetical protein